MRADYPGSPWPAADATLRALWESGLSTAAIGAAMGLSKYAILGRAHRLQLPARPSPISKKAAVPAPKVVRAPRVTLAPLASVDLPPVIVQPEPPPSAMRKNCHPGSPWPEADERLRALWDEGLRAGAIGAQLGLSKNAIIGRAHRLNLPERPSPIIRPSGGPKPAAPPRAAKVTLPPPHIGNIEPEPAAARRAVRAEPAVPRAMSARCCFITDNSRRFDVQYCDAPCQAGRSYCEAHHARCHGSPGTRSEAMADQLPRGMG